MVRSIALLNTSLSVGLFLAFSIGIFLIAKRRQHNPANHYLGGILLIFGIIMLPGYFGGGNLLDQFPHVIGIDWLITFLIGPLIYFYARASIERDFVLRGHHAWHLLPTVFAWFYVWPLLLRPGNEKVQFWEQFMALGIHGGIPVWDPIVRALVLAVYSMLSIRIALRYRKYLQGSSSNLERRYDHWLVGIIVGLIIPMLGLILIAVTHNRIISATTLVSSIIAFTLTVFFAILCAPGIFRSFPNRMSTVDTENDTRQKYQTSSLTEKKKERLTAQLLAYMEAEHPYREPHLTMSGLGERLNIPSHYLSQLINEQLNCTFPDFINSYRVKTAQRLLHDPQFSHFSSVGIGFEAGFSSKSTYYSAFRRYAGTSPGYYRKSLKYS